MRVVKRKHTTGTLKELLGINMGRYGSKPDGNVSIDYYVERGGEEVELKISAHISPYDPGRTYGSPEKCYPPEGGECEIISITSNKVEWEDKLTEEEL